MPKIAGLVAVMVFPLGVGAYATRSTSLGLTVTVRPAVALTMQGAQAIGVQIRLAPQTKAKLWKSDECVLMPPDAYVISESGIYTVLLTEIEGQGSKVCLVSSDGTLSASVSLPPT